MTARPAAEGTISFQLRGSCSCYTGEIQVLRQNPRLRKILEGDAMQLAREPCLHVIGGP